MSYLIRGGRVVDPATGRDETLDVLIEGTSITEVAAKITSDAGVVDASGCIVAPALVDMHTHVREPGREDEETIATASAAAAAGGYSAICAMPNTDPVADTAAVVETVWSAGRDCGLVEVLPAGALTRGQMGTEMADLGEMYHSPARVRLFTDDGKGVQDALIARRLMEYLKGFDAIYAEHCEVEALARDGHMHEGERSISLGLRGQPAAAEELMVARDIALARLTGCRLHLLHLSTARSVDHVRAAKAEGMRVTAEATPHHFSLTDGALASYDPNAKVNPPLRTEEDRLAVIQGLADGTIDAIATDHAPHAPEEKDQEITLAPPGLIGLETALALVLTELVEPGHLSLGAALGACSSRPARILGLDSHGGPIEAGAPAHLCVFDPELSWIVEPPFRSRSANTPFLGRTLKGRVRHTFYGGRQTVSDSKVTGEVLV